MLNSTDRLISVAKFWKLLSRSKNREKKEKEKNIATAT